MFMIRWVRHRTPTTRSRRATPRSRGRRSDRARSTRAMRDRVARTSSRAPTDRGQRLARCHRAPGRSCRPPRSPTDRGRTTRRGRSSGRCSLELADALLALPLRDRQRLVSPIRAVEDLGGVQDLLPAAPGAPDLARHRRAASRRERVELGPHGDELLLDRSELGAKIFVGVHGYIIRAARRHEDGSASAISVIQSVSMSPPEPPPRRSCISAGVIFTGLTVLGHATSDLTSLRSWPHRPQLASAESTPKRAGNLAGCEPS